MKRPRRRRRPAAVAAVTLALATGLASTSSAGLTEFAIPNTSADPVAITTGPDGNLWFAENGAAAIGRVTTSGAFAEFALPNSGNILGEIASGPDGNIWFTERGGDLIGRITTSGTITEFPLTASAVPQGIAAGPDGALWFAEDTGNKIGRITTGGTVTEFPVPTAGSSPQEIAVGPDGNLWFTEATHSAVGRATTAGSITEFSLPSGGNPGQISAGPDGNLWLTASNPDRIAKVTTAGAVTEFPLAAGTFPTAIVSAPDGNLWFTEDGAPRIGRMTTAGALTEFPLRGDALSVAEGLTVGPDQNIWFTDDLEYIGRLTIGPAPNASTAAATSVGDTAATLNGIVNPQSWASTYRFDYGTTTAYGASTATADAGSDTSDHAVGALLSGLSPGTVYHYRIVATSAFGTSTGADQTLTTQSIAAAAPSSSGAPPPPVFATSVDAQTVSGKVLVKVPGKGFVPLTSLAQVAVGSVLDTRAGRVRLSIADPAGKVSTADFYEGVFQVVQLAKDKGVAQLKLVGEKAKLCGTQGHKASVSRKPKELGHLWGSGSGSFRTVGRYASATIRGTTWDTVDRCDGTLVKVAAGSVTVRDLVTNKSAVVKAPKSYLAAARKHRRA